MGAKVSEERRGRPLEIKIPVIHGCETPRLPGDAQIRRQAVGHQYLRGPYPAQLQEQLIDGYLGGSEFARCDVGVGQTSLTISYGNGGKVVVGLLVQQ